MLFQVEAIQTGFDPMRGYPTPCMDICRYELEGHCVACSMTKAQKALFGALKREAAQAQFLRDLQAQQEELRARLGAERFAQWATAYRHKCRAFGKTPPE